MPLDWIDVLYHCYSNVNSNCDNIEMVIVVHMAFCMLHIVIFNETRPKY